jgi:FtsP/CotA-like multicopper oxidase with cupredoxin domain
MKEDTSQADLTQRLSRRDLLKVGALSSVGLATAGGAFGLQDGASPKGSRHSGGAGRISSHHDMGAIGELRAGGFDPTKYVTEFDSGRVSRLPSGQVLREYQFVALEREIEVVPGVFYPVWTYNGQVPGPTIRCTEGDRIRVQLTNATEHPHSIHFHGTHPAEMDGAFEAVPPGGRFTYEFDAEPFGLHLYHCHTVHPSGTCTRDCTGCFWSIRQPPDRPLASS